MSGNRTAIITKNNMFTYFYKCFLERKNKKLCIIIILPGIIISVRFWNPACVTVENYLFITAVDYFSIMKKESDTSVISFW
jgi:hypothetical protein